MSLLMTAKAIGLNPTIYFRDVLLRMSRGEDAAKLTPHGWKQRFADEVAARHDELAKRLGLVAP